MKWADLPRVVHELRVAMERGHMPWRISWQGRFSMVVTHSELSLPGNPSDRCLSHNLKYLKKSDRSTAWSSSMMDNGKVKETFSFSECCGMVSEAYHSTHMAITPNHETKEQDQHNPKARGARGSLGSPLHDVQHGKQG